MRATWVSYVAATWAFVFASASFYWALGGRIGLETIGPGLATLTNDPWFVAIGLWGVGVAKVAGGLLALALIRLRQRRRVHRLIYLITLIGGSLAALYGAASLVQHVLMITGAIAIPAGLGRVATTWHIVLWDPWWVIGGVLFVTAARRSRAL